MALAVLALGCEGSGVSASARPAEKAQEQRADEAKPTGVWADIAALRRGGRTKVRYAPPRGDEADRYGAWVTAAVEAAAAEDAPPRAPDGFEVSVHEGGKLWLLQEQPQRRRGAGAVVLRVGAAGPLVVEAPHTFFDEGTLALSRDTFERARARALLLNTAHRANAARGMGEAEAEEAARAGTLASDVAHAENSFFQAAHVALTRGTTVRRPAMQLHGFRDGFVPADAIVSAAGGEADVAPAVQRIRSLFPTLGIAEYGHDTKRLGGTTNTQARDAREHGVPFVHVELSRKLRTRLQQDSPARGEVLDALVAQAARFHRKPEPSGPKR